MDLIDINLFEISSPKQWKNLPSNQLTEEGYNVYGANGIIGKFSEYTHENPVIAITCRGATSGNVHLTLPKSFITSNAMVLDELDTSKIYINYLFYYLKKRGFNDVITGSAQPQITRESLKSVNLRIPVTYADQIRIANVLGKIEEVIQERKNAIEQLDELVKATFYDMFGDPVRNEKGWDLIDFDKLISFKRGFDLPTSKRISGKFPLCSSNGITDRINEYKIKGPGIFTGRSGTIGNVFVTYEDYWPLNTSLYSESYNGNIVYLTHLARYFKLERYVNGTGVPTLNRNNFNKEKIINVPPNFQKKFATIAQKIETIKTEQEAQLREMEALYASVSHQAFTGMLDLSRISFDESLLPTEIEEVLEPIVVEKHREIENTPRLQLNGLNGKRTKDVLSSSSEWSKLSFQKIADLITNHFKTNYFNSEMLLRFLTEEAKLTVDYFSSKEQKVNLKLEKANDFLVFLTDAVTDKNPYLELEQVFYNAEEENISNITFTENDLESLRQKPTKERSGIYFRIKDETTTR